MSAVQILGIVAGALFVSLMAGIAIGRTLFGRSPDDASNEHAEPLFIGGADLIHRERN